MADIKHYLFIREHETYIITPKTNGCVHFFPLQPGCVRVKKSKIKDCYLGMLQSEKFKHGRIDLTMQSVTEPVWHVGQVQPERNLSPGKGCKACGRVDRTVASGISNRTTTHAGIKVAK